MTPPASTTLEHELQEAHLLCVRREFEAAKLVLNDVLRRCPDNGEARYMLARIASTERAARQEAEQSRALRYSFNLQTTWRRVSWGLTAAVLLAYGLWSGADALSSGFGHGFGAVITTMVYQSRRYSPGRYVPWTRPVYVDLLYSAAILAAAAFMGFILWRASKGIAQWEELDTGIDYGGRWDF